MDIFHAQFSSGQVSAASGVTNATLQSWLKRNLVVGQKDRPIEGGGSPGKYRRYSFFNVMEIAIAKSLLDAGMGSVEYAFRAARSFAHVGRSEISPDRPARVPSLPFWSGGMSALTLIAVRGDCSTHILWRVGSDPLPEILAELGGRGGFVLTEVDEVFDRVVGALGYRPVEVMQQAYGKG